MPIQFYLRYSTLSLAIVVCFDHSLFILSILSACLSTGRLNVAASSLTERLACELVRMSILCRFFGLLCRECSHRKVNTKRLKYG